MYLQIAVSHTFSAALCLHLYVFISHFVIDLFDHLLAFPPRMHIDIQFSHKHAVEVKYLCDVFKSTAIAYVI